MIAVDGFSSCGKSTFAKLVAARLGYIFIDTGAMYRAVTLYAIEHGCVTNGILDEDKLIAALDDITISFRFNPDRGASDIYVNDEWVEGKIRTITVSNLVSRVSAIGEVRTRLVALQQEMGREKGVVMDGRDIGTVVFPNAELKIYMTAIRMRSLSGQHFLFGDRGMNRASTVEQHNLLLGTFFGDVAAEVAVGDEENLLLR